MKDLRALCPQRNGAWTIDIAYLLKAFDVDAVYHTVTRGVRAEYSGQKFYRRGFAEDTLRVNGLFRDADVAGVRIIEERIALNVLRDRLKHTNNDDNNDSMAIVLVHKDLLTCSNCQNFSIVSSSPPLRYLQFAQTPFVGHFVLLYAWYEPSDTFLIKDPAALRDTCVVDASVLEAARSAFGTDDDVLMITKRKH